jgi:thiamine biosynthesis lipoprotein
MGTFFEADLRVAPEDGERARRWLSRARSEIARLERIYSRYDEQSEISRLNRALAHLSSDSPDRIRMASGPARSGALVGPELGALLTRSIELSRATGGAFTIAIGPLVDLWLEAAASDRWPTEAELRTRRSLVGGARIESSREGERFRLVVAGRGARVELDALSKGAVLDRLKQTLVAELPEAAALLSLGESSVVAIGDPGGGGWRLALRSRDPMGRRPATIRLRDRALSASSSIGSVSEIDGRRVSHVIDPRTGLPVEGVVETLVLADEATDADAWSTALLVLGGHGAALERVETAGLEARIVDSSGRTWTTAGWSKQTGG